MNSGRMSVEELFRKFFMIELSQPDFWEMCLAGIERKIAAFEKAARTYKAKQSAK